jgi:hypothetical protein
MEGYKTESDTVEPSDEELKEMLGLNYPPSSMYEENPFGKKLFDYFRMLINSNYFKTENISEELIFTLKQFLTDEFLCPTEIFEKLENTQFRVTYKSVLDRIQDLVYFGLIKERGKDSYQEKIPKAGTINYRLSPLGIFYLLFKFEKRDPVANIFKYYKKDLFFQYFIYPVINKETITAISSIEILRIFINYSKQICLEIIKELLVVDEIRKKGYSESPCLKWKHNLKKDSTEWIKFSIDSLYSIFPVPLGDLYKASKQKQPISQLEVTDKSISFLMNNRKYCLVLDKEKDQATLYINGVEGTGITYKPHKARLKVKPDCYIIYKLEFAHVDSYVQRLETKFKSHLWDAEFPIGMSVLRLFFKHTLFAEVAAEANKDNHIKIYYNDLSILAKDEKIKKLINKIYSEIQEHYEDFLRYVQ